MTVQEIAQRFVALCQEGKFEAAGKTFWSDDIVSIEPMGPQPVSRGLAAMAEKHAWWEANHEIHSTAAHGPYVANDQFVVRFTMDVTPKATGQRMTMDEVGLYTVKDGKIVEERFLYGGMG